MTRPGNKLNGPRPSPKLAVTAAAGGWAVSGRRLAVRRPQLRLMLALLTAEAVVLGALDLLIAPEPG